MQIFGFTLIRTEELIELEAEAMLAGLPDPAAVMNDVRLTRLERRVAGLEQRSAQAPRAQRRNRGRHR